MRDQKEHETAAEIFLRLIKETELVLEILRGQLDDAWERNDVGGQLMSAISITESNKELEDYKKSLQFLLDAKGQ